MRTLGLPLVDRGLRLSVLAAAGVFVLFYLFVAAVRIRYPYELEWLEGAAADHVGRILAGHPLYAPPSLDFTAFIYPPLYFYASALVAKVTGLGFFPLRLVATVSSLAVFALMYAIVRRETADRFAGIVSVGLFAATYRAGGAWFDVGRVDSMALALVLGAAFLIRFGQARASVIVAAILLALAFHTKQSMLFICVSLALYVLWHRRRDALWFLTTLAGVTGLVGLGFYLANGGWYSYYVYELPMQHRPLPSKRFGYLWDDTLKVLPVTSLLAAGYMASQFGRNPERRAALAFYGLLSAGLITCSWLTRMNSGAWQNVLIPGFAALSILAGLVQPRIWNAVTGDASLPRRLVRVGIGLALLVQFALLAYNPLHQIPSSADRLGNDALVSKLRTLPGDVLVMHHGFLSTLAGKDAHAHWQALADVMRSDENAGRSHLAAELAQAFRQKRFAAVVLDNRPTFLADTGFDENYELRAWDDPKQTWPAPVTGVRRRPTFLYVPR